MSARVALVGIGLHGGRIAHELLSAGHQLIGAADPAHAGRPISDLIDHELAPATPVAADATALLDCEKPDLAIVTAPVDLEGLGAIATKLLDAGIDVLTIHPDAFDPPPAWAELIDEHARTGGASFLSTGVQDVWWVHVPAVAAAATSRLRRVEIEHAADMGALSIGLGNGFGFDRPEEEFTRVRDEVLLTEESVLGGPMRVLARRLGLTPEELNREYTPLIATEPVAWPSADTVVEPGRLIGFTEIVTFTADAVQFSGRLRTALLTPGMLPSDRVTLHGDPVITLEHKPFPGDRITDLVPVARIDDIRAAPPGLHTAASMPPASYRHRPTPDLAR
ncbi:MAG TPA: hypothetical protein VNT22_10695 [Baekduia sp.]|nr:hypothetical protein [Baekduia sp.]